MATTKIIRLSLTALLVTGFLTGCKSKPPEKTPEELAIEQFQPKIYPMQVKGIVFSMDMPVTEGEDLQQQQDKIFTAINEEDPQHKTARKYIKTQKLPDQASTYILRTGIKASHPEHLFDTFLEYKITANCQLQKKSLHCEYKAIDGFYSIDLPQAHSLNGDQTAEQMEGNETATLALLNTHPLTKTESFNSTLPLSKLKPVLQKKYFSVESKGSGLALYSAKFDYNAELTQKKVKSTYITTASFEVTPKKAGAYHSDFVTPFNQALRDIKETIQ